MARVGLSLVGFAIAGPLGGMIGGFVGGVVDSFLFAGKQEGPRLDDLSVTASTYGAAIPLVYGPQVRMSGNIIWSSGLIETKTTKRAGKGGPKVTTYSYAVSLAVLISGRPIRRITKVMANNKVLFDLAAAATPPADPTPDVGMVVTSANGASAAFAAFRVYQGNGTQLPDPTIEAALGVGLTPAYRHRAYVVFDNLQLADFGNAIPNLEFFVEADETITDGGICGDVCDRAGITDASTSALTRSNLGFVIGRADTALAALEPLRGAAGFDIAEQGGQIRFVPRGRAMLAAMDPGDLGAAMASDDSRPAQPIIFERVMDPDLPRSAQVTFADPALDLQPNTQSASRDFGRTASNRAAELPMTLSADEGRQAADMLLWGDFAGRRTAKTTVSDRWGWMAPCNIIGLPVAGGVLPYKLLRINKGANGVYEAEFQHEDPAVFQSAASGSAGVLPSNPLKLPGETRLVLFNAPMLRPGDDDAGFYWAATGDQAGWRGAEIERSSTGTYSPMATTGVRAPIGDVAVALADGPTAIMDLGNSLSVVLVYTGETLESVSDEALLGGANAAWLGAADGSAGEVIQFGTATLTAPGTWTLSRLLRGRMGTEHAVAGHGADEVLVLLEPGSLGRTDFGAGDWDAARNYKGVSALTAEADTMAQAFTNNGEGKRPLAPVNPSGTRDGSSNLTVTFYRRSRITGPGLFGGPPPLGEEAEAYEIDILDGATVVRTIPSAATSFAYSAAEQTADGLTPGDPVTGNIHQISAVRGRGHACAFTV